MFRNLNLGALGFKAPLYEAADLAIKGGFQGIDIDIFEIENLLKMQSADDIKEMLKRKKLKLGGWGLPVNFRKDDETFQKDLDNLPRQAKMASTLGCFRVFTWLMPFSDTLPYKENFDLHVSRLREVANVLEDCGCVLGLEFVGPKTSWARGKYEFIHTMDGVLKLREAIKNKNVGLLLDCWHWYTSHTTVDQIRQLKSNDVVYVHVNDAPPGVPVDEQVDSIRRLPGETGVIDIVGFLNALRKIGYDGPVTPEPFDKSLKEMPIEKAVIKTGEAMKKVWSQAKI
ncbi:sugar phosphate isomerase/epimerase [Candidatus Bathyarchaeota archaeon]|nr:sugar phosphate isomerase/epimerase [Candidatus Bathyarchaeota archaeon]